MLQRLQLLFNVGNLSQFLINCPLVPLIELLYVESLGLQCLLTLVRCFDAIVALVATFGLGLLEVDLRPLPLLLWEDQVDRLFGLGFHAMVSELLTFKRQSSAAVLRKRDHRQLTDVVRCNCFIIFDRRRSIDACELRDLAHCLMLIVTAEVLDA